MDQKNNQILTPITQPSPTSEIKKTPNKTNKNNGENY